MEPLKLKDVQGPPATFMLEQRFGQMKKLYTQHGPHQSYLTLISSLLSENLTCLKELAVLDIKARTKAAVQWLSGDCVQPVTTAPLLPPFKTWPGASWVYRRRSKPYLIAAGSEDLQAQMQARMTESRVERLQKELEEARLITTQLVQLMDESKKVLTPPKQGYGKLVTPPQVMQI